MGTRGVIARPADRNEGAFTGRYHHWDSYPTGLGATLFELRNGFFKGNTDALLKVLLDDHPAGWSTICDKDFSQRPGFQELDFSAERVASNQPQCYCHGSRSEEAQEITEEDASSCGAEYVYVLAGPVMHVLSSRNADGSKMIGMFGCGNPDATWTGIARVDLDGPAPDWSSIA